MFLSQVELTGFKSFAHKTVIKFNEGITAIVGPNGCGKTNVVDAIRWVLGEQKSSVLRSDRMEDVIFNGTMNRKRLGYTEVSIIIENTKNILPIEYSQVMITRRLFRSGESEYLLNKQTCRLKDISNLLMDSGMGADAYSVIELNMVEKILNDSDDYRSRLFEEAAGIMKYKVRRNEALRKLEASRQDVVRIRDIIIEVERTVNSLRSQVGRASRYEVLKSELTAVEKKYYNARYRELMRKKEPIESEIQNLINHSNELSGKSAKKQAYIDKTQSEILAYQDAVAQAQEELNAFSEKVHITDTTYAKLQERLNALQETEKRLLSEATLFEQRMKDSDSMLHNVLNEAAVKKEELKVIQEKLEDAIRKRNKFLEEYKQKKSVFMSKNQQLFDIIKKLEELRRKTDSLIRDENEHKAQSERLKELRVKSQSRLEELTASGEQIQKEINRITDWLHIENNNKEQTAQQIETITKALSDMQKKIYNTKITLESLRTKHTLLQNLIEQYEGLPSGVSEVLKVKQTLPGIKGTIGELISVEKGFEVAFESALGEQIHYIVAETYSDCKRAVDYLRAKEGGRATFVALDSLPPEEKQPLYKQFPVPDSIGFPLLEKISIPGYLRNLMTVLLGDVIYITVDDETVHGDTALPLYLRKVSKEGTVKSAGYLYTGGGIPDVNTSIVGRKERISEIKSKITAFEKDIAALENELKDYNSKKQQLNENLNIMNDRIAVLSQELQSVKHRQGILWYEIEQVQRTLEQTDKDIKQLDEISFDENRIAELEKAIELKESEWNTLKNECEQFQSEEDLLENDRRNYEELISEQYNQKAMLSEMINSFEKEIVRSKNLLKEYTNSLTERQRNLEETRKHYSTTQEQVVELRLTLEKLFEEQREYENTVLTRREELNKIQEEKQSDLHEFLEMQKHITSLQEKLQKNKEQLIETQQELKFLTDTYQVKGIYIDPAMEFDETVDIEKIVAQKQQLIKKIELFGPVNMEAVDEYNKERERLSFLQNQLQDLEDAEKTLVDTINKINIIAHERFSQTFNQVRDNFRVLFKKLFSDGEADLVYTEREDPLDAKIDVFAQPFGKKVQSIGLLSGGEKALTAIAILFSIYLVKPSPFCILDEVDAPLDDSNVARFVKILNEFSRDTQFIIVTHNKKTMEAADYLYGVTMEETGISKIISVRLNEKTEILPVSGNEAESTMVNN